MRITRFEFTQLHDFKPKSDHISFDSLIEEMEEQEIAAPLAPSFTEQEVETAKKLVHKQGYDEGFDAGMQKVTREQQERERETLAALQSLLQRIEESQQGYDSAIAEQSRDLYQFIIAVARKIAGEALTHRPDLAVKELIGMCLPILVQKPRLAIEANTALVDQLKPSIGEALAQAGFEGEVHFRTNDTLEASDCRLEWQGGYAERHTAAIWKEVEAMLEDVTFYPELSVEKLKIRTETKE